MRQICSPSSAINMDSFSLALRSLENLQFKDSQHGHWQYLWLQQEYRQNISSRWHSHQCGHNRVLCDGTSETNSWHWQLHLIWGKQDKGNSFLDWNILLCCWNLGLYFFADCFLQRKCQTSFTFTHHPSHSLLAIIKFSYSENRQVWFQWWLFLHWSWNCTLLFYGVPILASCDQMQKNNEI